ncbi:hypothetical protein HJB80_02785 [Rhizobium lentis]|uniref:DUF5681 domain-containing protein n=1 Tax=Rhizobium lentis TaxID=1138194 RepID=UPI001C840A69|nr:DUF5681 domain-containing protein [Rhizobium lentis]MBX5131618.1 hypothetical protein [Rhizobium lentis]
MTFEAGKSGNPGGRPKAKPFKDALMMEALAAEREEECLAPKGSLRWNARKLLEQGDVSSIREIADRLDGKVPQSIAGDEENPLNFVHTITRHIVRANSGNPDS